MRWLKHPSGDTPVDVIETYADPRDGQPRHRVRTRGGGELVCRPEDLAGEVVPMARNTDPDTSHQAAQRAAIAARSNAALLLIAHADAGRSGLTGDEIETATGRAYQSIGPRRPALERDGLVRKAIGDDGRLVARNDKQVYVITPMGEIEANRLRRESA